MDESIWDLPWCSWIQNEYFIFSLFIVFICLKLANKSWKFSTYLLINLRNTQKIWWMFYAKKFTFVCSKIFVLPVDKEAFDTSTIIDFLMPESFEIHLTFSNTRGNTIFSLYDIFCWGIITHEHETATSFLGKYSYYSSLFWKCCNLYGEESGELFRWYNWMLLWIYCKTKFLEVQIVLSKLFNIWTWINKKSIKRHKSLNYHDLFNVCSECIPIMT